MIVSIGECPESIEKDLSQIVRLQILTLPGSSLSMMGPIAVRSYFRFVESSTRETCLYRREESVVCGFGVLTEDSDTLPSRYLRSSPISLAMAIGARFWNWRVIKRAICSLTSKSVVPPRVQGLPQIIQLAVHPAWQNKGIGRLLVEQAENRLRMKGHKTYYVKTEKVEDNGAFNFYKKIGFDFVGDGSIEGVSYQFLMKGL